MTQRLAFFTGNYDLVSDGVALTLNRLVSYLSQRGTETRVFAPVSSASRPSHGGTLVRVPSVTAPFRSEYRVSLGLGRHARCVLERFRPTLIHIATPDVLGRAALRFARQQAIPAVASYHTNFCAYLRYYRLAGLEAALWTYLRRFYRQCRQVYVASPSMADVLRAQGFGGELRLWERGVDGDEFQPARRSLAWRRSRGIADTVPLVTFVGRMVPEKGIDVLAEVLRALEAAGTPHRSMVVGNGPAARRLAARLPRTVFTGFLRGDELATAYASSDVFLFPSDTETFGNVTLEAMASGLPAVCADAPGSSSLVVHGTTGFLARPGDGRSFSAHLRRLLADATLRRRMGSAAREQACTYSWDAALAKIDSCYAEVLQSQEHADTALTPVPVGG